MIRHDTNQDSSWLAMAPLPLQVNSDLGPLASQATLVASSHGQAGGPLMPDAAGNHPPQIHASAVLVMLLLAVSISALLYSWFAHREVLGLRRIRDRYRELLAGADGAQPLPVKSRAGPPAR